ARITKETPPAPRELVANVPADLAAICKKAMEKEAGRRYGTAQEFGDDLGRWLGSEPTRARPARVPRRVWLWGRRNPGWAAAIASVGLALLVATVLGLHSANSRAAAAKADAAAAVAKAAA